MQDLVCWQARRRPARSLAAPARASEAGPAVLIDENQICKINFFKRAMVQGIEKN